ncbi:clavaminate synthase-like protein At3g21360 isoform X2 [Solanum pennellii]|uniref:Clavaminate synthase-like protein At3g21360 isoform X2 n=1 Tax=Solanum pennellii TaxID=28526 RepID=A0ABM1V6I4_SOLPN|nr:clavaminate synthase-like protein At3g21360 isoform X2 [Solanum pennellii]
MPENLLTQVGVPQQKLYNGVPFPAVLSPNSNQPKSQLPQIIKEQKTWIGALLHQSGAILFRGFPVNSASDFNDVVEAFDYEELPYVGGAAPRTSVVGRVFTANESPPDQKIPFHHEMAQVPEYPSKLFFFCDVEPGSGGETPIVLSNVVYEKMKNKYPEFVERLEEHGLIYIRVLGEDDDPSSPIGRGWKSTFLTKDKSVAEERFHDLTTWSIQMMQCLKQTYCTFHMRISDSSVLEKRKLQDVLGTASFEQHKNVDQLLACNLNGFHFVFPPLT